MSASRRTSFLIALVGSAVLAGCASGLPADPAAVVVVPQSSRCLSDAEVVQWAQAYAARQPLSNPPAAMNAADAACTRTKFQQQLAGSAGPLVGYKVNLSNLQVQKTFHIDEPVWGSYYQSMLLPSRSSVDARYGAQPLYKGSLMVRVKSSAINQASTPEAVLQQVDQIIPYIELADMQVQKPSELTAHHMTAINAGARMGIQGTPLSVSADSRSQKRLLKELETMNVRVIGNKGRLLGRGKGSDVMGHPLQSVVWLAEALRKQGLALEPGQWVSVGAFTPLLRPKAGETVTVAYPGLTGARSVVVRFK
ncbi:MAG: fumarylacetoacetate hydrolase [Brachymonas sp.]|nr:fumarylacetoacetate hydrolase [Brachymonas sp.]